MIRIHETILLLIFIPASYALWCPEGCNCDNENLFVICGNEETQQHLKEMSMGESEDEFKFSSIPITLNPHIKKLYVLNTSLERLDATLQNYPYLEELRLGGNKIQYLSPGSPFYSQNYLRSLSLRDNIIRQIETPDCFQGLNSLKKLDLSGNKLTTLRAEINVFRDLQQLESLDLSNNRLSWVAPDVFSPLISIVHLNLDYNKLLVVPFTVPFATLPTKLLPGLRSLSIAYNPLKSEYVGEVIENNYEKTVSKFTYNPEIGKKNSQKITEESEKNENLETDVKESGPMSRIERIDLSGIDTQRTNICVLLSRLPMLKELIFYNTVADSLACIETLSSLESLEIGGDVTLTQLEPSNLYAMPNLRELMVTNSSNLISISDDAFVSNAYLEEITIKSNHQLKQITLSTFSRLPYLKYLSLTNNSIDNIFIDLNANHQHKTSTARKMEQNHFPQLKQLDISGNNFDCNCTLQSLFLSLSLTIRNFRGVNITCKEKEKTHTENTYSSSYYINFVGPSGRYNNDAEMRRNRCSQNHSEQIVETILTVLLVGFILLILVSFPVVGGGVAYFYFYKRRFAKKRNDNLRYDFISEPQQISLAEAATLNYIPHRSSTTYLDTTLNRPNPEGISGSMSALTLVHSKSLGSDMPGAFGSSNGLTLSSASNLQQKIFANKIITSDYPTSTMTPNFAWDDMTEINLTEYQKQEYYEETNPHFIPFSTRKIQCNDVHKSMHGGIILSNPRLNLRPKNFSNEHLSYSNAFNGEDCLPDNLEPIYSSESFVQDSNFIPDPLTYSTRNQVNLIDFIGGNQRYLKHDNDI